MRFTPAPLLPWLIAFKSLLRESSKRPPGCLGLLCGLQADVDRFRLSVRTFFTFDDDNRTGLDRLRFDLFRSIVESCFLRASKRHHLRLVALQRQRFRIEAANRAVEGRQSLFGDLVDRVARLPPAPGIGAR